MTNESGLEPLGAAVLVKPYTQEQQVGRIILAQKTEVIEQRAIVVEVGPNAWADEPVPRAKPGDLVLISGFAGYACIGPADDVSYRMVNGRDIFARITKEKNHVAQASAA